MSIEKKSGIIGKIWNFIWYEDSLFSWIVNLILAFVIVKWIIYPLIGFVLSTSFPIVAVVSGSMEHGGLGFDSWWEQNGWYTDNGITKEEFLQYPFVNGFNKGDIMVLKGVKPKDIKRGDILVYESLSHSNPIIHRVVKIEQAEEFEFTTKGDNNNQPDLSSVNEGQIKKTGKAIFRLPWLGWIKIWFVSLLELV